MIHSPSSKAIMEAISSPVIASQIRVEASPADTTYLLSGVNLADAPATQSAWPERIFHCASAARSQMTILPSLPPETAYRPLGEKAADITPPIRSWPTNFFTWVNVFAFHTRVPLSELPVMT